MLLAMRAIHQERTRGWRVFVSLQRKLFARVGVTEGIRLMKLLMIR